MINWSVNGGLISFYEWLDWVLVSFFVTSLFVYFLVWIFFFFPNNGHHDIVLDLYWWFALILSNRSSSSPILICPKLELLNFWMQFVMICHPESCLYSFIGNSYFCRNVHPCPVERDNCTDAVWCTMTDPNP